MPRSLHLHLFACYILAAFFLYYHILVFFIISFTLWIFFVFASFIFAVYGSLGLFVIPLSLVPAANCCYYLLQLLLSHFNILYTLQQEGMRKGFRLALS